MPVATKYLGVLIAGDLAGLLPWGVLLPILDHFQCLRDAPFPVLRVEPPAVAWLLRATLVVGMLAPAVATWWRIRTCRGVASGRQGFAWRAFAVVSFLFMWLTLPLNVLCLLVMRLE